MNASLRSLIVLARPAVVVLLGLFAVTGMAQAGVYDDPVLLLHVLVPVVAFLLCSVLVNDIADAEIDAVNLPGDCARPLVVGSSHARDLRISAITAGAVALASAATLGWQAAAVTVGGLALSCGYSMRPVRLADRGAVAAMLLPAGYVAVPYLTGVLAARSSIRAADLALLGGLYVGFIGRILLKDFRDVRGDALFGKRTFLVRHGRRRTCQLSAILWVAGAITIAAVRGPLLAVGFTYVAFFVAALAMLRALATNRGPRRDEALISAIAIVGRGMVVTVIAQLSITDAGWPLLAHAGVLAVWAAVVLGQARFMALHGPTTRTTVPNWVLAEDDLHLSPVD